MSDSEINYMDIVPDAGPIVCVVIIAKYAELLELAHRHLRDVRHQIVGNTIGVLAHRTALMRPDRVKVTKEDHVPLRISLLHI